MASEHGNDALTKITPEARAMLDHFLTIQFRYQAAIREVQTKLEILDSEFQTKHRRNPIHHMQSRLKSVASIMEKLQRRGLPLTMNTAVEHLMDIAGVRVICSYIDDIYAIAEMITRQDDVRVIKRRDYIQQPKENGYRSLHLVVDVPVYLSGAKLFIPVEVQIRTVAMDFWASLEHDLRYKAPEEIPSSIVEELKKCADIITETDFRMEQISRAVHQLRDEL